MKRYILALDLKDDPALIQEYEQWHRTGNGWPEITRSIQEAGITGMEIYRTGNRLFMIMDTDDSFSFEKKNDMDVNNPVVQQWEQLMWKYQQPLPWAREGEKWMIMKRIYQLQTTNNSNNG